MSGAQTFAAARMNLRRNAPATLHVTLTKEQAEIVLEALNSHESKLAAEWQAAFDAGSNAKRAELSKQMDDCRGLGHVLYGFMGLCG